MGLLTIALSISACSQANSDKQDNQKTQMTMDYPFPFKVMDNDGQFTILAELESGDLFEKYFPFFEKHGYEGNGYCWEGHITQILEKKDKELLNHIEFDQKQEHSLPMQTQKKLKLNLSTYYAQSFLTLNNLKSM